MMIITIIKIPITKIYVTVTKNALRKSTIKLKLQKEERLMSINLLSLLLCEITEMFICN